MNKTISINISGFVFNIEEDTYKYLSDYLDKIKVNFSNQEEQEEIMEDIEMRIAELLQKKITPHKEVIIDADITEIIQILGNPEDFADSDNQVEHETKKRLFRDTDNTVIGGVCSGLGHYFNKDTVFFRVSFLLLFFLFGTGVLLYIILLFIIPEAKTTSDKLEMKGQPINLASIKDHVSNIKQSVKIPKNKENIKSTLNSVINT